MMKAAMKTGFVMLVALIMSCEATCLAAAGFPTGTYMRCAQGVHNPTGNEFLNTAGFQDGARLILTRNGTTVTTTYVDENGRPISLNFSATTDTVATITQKGQVILGLKSLCVLGPGKQTAHPASMNVTGGAL